MSATIAITIGDTLWDGEPDEGVLTTWFYSEGSEVRAGEVLAEIMVEKVEMEVASPARGKLRILVPPQGVIRRGTTIGQIVAVDG